jgi:IS1 family transposase
LVKKNKIWLWTAVNHFQPGILGWVLGTHSAITFRPLWELVGNWKCYFYITDGWPVYPMFIPDGDQIICKTYMTRVEGENTRLRHYLARLHRKTLCYSKSVEMLKHSMRLVIHYLKFWEVPVPYPSYHFKRALAEANRVAKTSLDPTNHTSIQQRQISYPDDAVAVLSLGSGYT